MTDSRVLDHLAEDKQKAQNGIVLGLELMTATLQAYLADYVSAGAANCTGRIPLLKKMQEIVGGLTASEAQLSLVYSYERRDVAGVYSPTKAERAAEEVVAEARELADIYEAELPYDRALVRVVEAVEDLDEAEEDEELEATHPGIIILPPPNTPEEQAELVAFFRSLGINL